MDKYVKNKLKEIHFFVNNGDIDNNDIRNLELDEQFRSKSKSDIKTLIAVINDYEEHIVYKTGRKGRRKIKGKQVSYQRLGLRAGVDIDEAMMIIFGKTSKELENEIGENIKVFYETN